MTRLVPTDMFKKTGLKGLFYLRYEDGVTLPLFSIGGEQFLCLFTDAPKLIDWINGGDKDGNSWQMRGRECHTYVVSEEFQELIRNSLQFEAKVVIDPVIDRTKKTLEYIKVKFF